MAGTVFTVFQVIIGEGEGECHLTKPKNKKEISSNYMSYLPYYMNMGYFCLKLNKKQSKHFQLPDKTL